MSDIYYDKKLDAIVKFLGDIFNNKYDVKTFDSQVIYSQHEDNLIPIKDSKYKDNWQDIIKDKEFIIKCKCWDNFKNHNGKTIKIWPSDPSVENGFDVHCASCLGQLVKECTDLSMKSFNYIAKQSGLKFKGD